MQAVRLFMFGLILSFTFMYTSADLF